PTATGRFDSQRLPAPHRLFLALQVEQAEVLVGDGAVGETLRGVADYDSARLGDGLKARRGVHDIAEDQTLLVAAGADGGLARVHTDPELEAVDACLFAQSENLFHEFEPGAHGALGVVRLRTLRSPEDGDGVPGELVDFAPETLDHTTAAIEVGGEQGPDTFRVEALRERGEADEVAEQDRDQATFGRSRRRGFWVDARGGCFVSQCGAAFGAEPVS